jgi:hypothetical protein
MLGDARTATMDSISYVPPNKRMQLADASALKET